LEAGEFPDIAGAVKGSAKGPADLKTQRPEKAVDDFREAFEMAVFMRREQQTLREDRTETGGDLGRDSGSSS
jgi:hypothetical protein